MSKPPIITTERFQYLIKGIEEDNTARELCFVLGAGASKSAGIPTGGEMAKVWFDEMPDKIGSDTFEQWKNKELTPTEVQLLKAQDYAQLYSAIYRKRFELDKETGYHSLFDLMKGKNPGKGHIILSQILRHTRHNCVVTTNFDSLIETAVFRFTSTQPFVCGHEALAQYAKPAKDIPLIVKIHRDLLTAPKSNPAEIDELDKNWQPVLNHIFAQRTPIIVGYGGNDGSLMTYFENMSTPPPNFFWCLYKDEEPSERIAKLVEKRNGIFIRHDGFDELMRELLIPFSDAYGNLKALEEDYNKQVKEFSVWMNDGSPKSKDNQHKPAAANENEKEQQPKQLSAWGYKLKADDELDLDKRAAIFEEALSKYPNTAWLWASAAYFYHLEKKDYTLVEKYYQKAIELGLDQDWFIGNYANFLHAVKKDYSKAEEFYLKALAAESNNAINNGNYAVFLKNVRKDYDAAENHYLKALAAEPNNANINGNYALFLSDIRKDYNAAKEHYLKALDIEPNESNANSNYAQLLLIKGDKKQADQHIQTALANKPSEQLQLEIAFYHYAHFFPEKGKEAEQTIQDLLAQGIRAEDWNFEANIEKAIADGHPHPQRLRELAKAINTPVEPTDKSVQTKKQPKK